MRPTDLVPAPDGRACSLHGRAGPDPAPPRRPGGAAVSAALALASWRRAAAALLAGALALSVAGGVATGTLSTDLLREVRHQLAPSAPAPDPGPRPCVELSGDDNRCPGG